ncbi:hypothetical protein D9Q98_005929 [Chlorella vulgaris]|uniref:Uncharacterized protein n=1 Tax=Chlorella vulgaris TaxID=3077 RepID=A0A9D4TWQ4_CHLVU|nr:hypothetical protein D9Q98_005929 [Chlorella vulgaris]
MNLMVDEEEEEAAAPVGSLGPPLAASWRMLLLQMEMQKELHEQLQPRSSRRSIIRSSSSSSSHRGINNSSSNSNSKRQRQQQLTLSGIMLGVSGGDGSCRSLASGLAPWEWGHSQPDCI